MEAIHAFLEKKDDCEGFHELREKWITDYVSARTFPIKPLGLTFMDHAF